MFEKIRSMSPKTRWFAFNWFIYFLALIVTALYCYARLDFARTQPPVEHVKKT